MSTRQLSERLTLKVGQRYLAADSVVVLSLERPYGAELPPWGPAAYIELLLETGLVRQYALCGDPGDLSCWHIAVMLDPHGRGGSGYIHDKLFQNVSVDVLGPRNNFEFKSSARYLFIADGIGITPILPIVWSAHARKAEWELHYAGRSLSSMPFHGEFPISYGDSVNLYPRNLFGPIDIDAILREPRPDTLVYWCGPDALLRAVEKGCSARTSGPLYLERFTLRDQQVQSSSNLDVVLQLGGITFEMHAGQAVPDVDAPARSSGRPVGHLPTGRKTTASSTTLLSETLTQTRAAERSDRRRTSADDYLGRTPREPGLPQRGCTQFDGATRMG
jgi:ferredoxin-NADP reductase